MNKATTRKSTAKDRVVAKSVDEYLAGVSQPARSTLQKIRATIRSLAPPGATEVISYGIPMFKYKGMLMGFAAFTDHCSLFPGAIVEEFKDELKDYRTSKGTIQFPVDKPPPTTLIRKIVKARVAQNEGKRR
jgi:uncharacterized protein YdhG (YjbR/CyaY superfamily)